MQEPLFVRGKSGLYYPFWAEIATSRAAFAMGRPWAFALPQRPYKPLLRVEGMTRLALAEDAWDAEDAAFL